MHDGPPVSLPTKKERPRFLTFVREGLPSPPKAGMAAGSAILLVLSFPDFEFWWLAWIGLTPLLFAVATTSRKRAAFVLGLIWGMIFFYGTCWWLTYPMTHHAGIAPWLAYPLLLIPVVFVSIFPALACLSISRLIGRFGSLGILAAPVVWITSDWLRSVVTGMDWNALGYSQAFHPFSVQPATWGGAFAVTFLIMVSNAALGLAIRERRIAQLAVSACLIVLVVLCLLIPHVNESKPDLPETSHLIIAIQPNVPMTEIEDSGYRQLRERHTQLSDRAFLVGRAWQTEHRLLIWPESPMNFSYSSDPQLQSIVGSLAQTHRTFVLLNSLERTSDGGSYNSAILINEQGQKVAQYDKIRLMPFGEYVPLPRWLPGSGSVRGIVGEFTPGSSYTLMPLGALRAGVFICIEAAHADVARSFTNAGAEVLINISNDGYLGPTPVMRQHLANAVFRAVENNRHVIRVTNSGISAYIDSDGTVRDTTRSFQEAVRTWPVSKGAGSTFYSRHGDVFAYGCALITLGLISATFMTRRKGTHAAGVLSN